MINNAQLRRNRTSASPSHERSKSHILLQIRGSWPRVVRTLPADARCPSILAINFPLLPLQTAPPKTAPPKIATSASHVSGEACITIARAPVGCAGAKPSTNLDVMRLAAGGESAGAAAGVYAWAEDGCVGCEGGAALEQRGLGVETEAIGAWLTGEGAGGGVGVGTCIVGEEEGGRRL